MEMVFLFLSLLILMYLCMKGVPVFLSSFIAGIFLLITAGLNPVDAMLDGYAVGLGGYFGKFFFIFIMGALFGKLTDISGAADSIAKAVIDKFGQQFIIPAIIIACAVLAYGGVSVFVALFTIYPMMVSLFRKANLPRYLMPAVYFAGAGTFACMMPGSPQIQNLIPSQYFGTTPTAALVPGIITAVFEMVLVFLYMNYCVKKARTKGHGYVMTEKDKILMDANKDKKLPNVLVAILPMVILLVALNVLKYSAELSLFIGVMAGLACYAPQIIWKDVFKNLGDGTMDGVRSLFNTAAVVGFGSLVQMTPAFAASIKAVTSMGGNPLISAAIAITCLAGIVGSGSGAQGIALPILAEYYLPLGVNPEALHRVSTLACLGLDSLPHNGLVVTALGVTGVSHKEGYWPIGVVTCVIPLISLVFMIGLFAVLPGWM